MIPRADMQVLCDAIYKYPLEIDKLPSRDKLFLFDMKQQLTHYGFSFSEKQSKWLQAIYRKVYENVEA